MKQIPVITELCHIIFSTMIITLNITDIACKGELWIVCQRVIIICHCCIVWNIVFLWTMMYWDSSVIVMWTLVALSNNIPLPCQRNGITNTPLGIAILLFIHDVVLTSPIKLQWEMSVTFRLNGSVICNIQCMYPWLIYWLTISTSSFCRYILVFPWDI